MEIDEEEFKRLKIRLMLIQGSLDALLDCQSRLLELAGHPPDHLPEMVRKAQMQRLAKWKSQEDDWLDGNPHP